ncbi:uncharacterized protein BCR38DRAFT_435476 [Pseudomassariella vexata]|uniref:Uncharacterized protein n=1 Tax=Pseudomassariella vexata TaxID=1141098 RepID=A0A1Y2DUL0_9PEZI|nr:uncharacterized protein BCR38DRAFT_435476 [Pseudomassariella vexata]ORY62937.1 hypothetical protein BCR38DRAFT_435476 [Pseudomassariella vexata]
MPAVAIKAGIIAVSLVVAAGVAIYESPEIRRTLEDLRRKIAVALHSLGDSISPQERENLLNRPEDAEGFLLSRGIDVRSEQGDQQGGELGVDADAESRRRQREELMYWNAIAEAKRAKERGDPEKTADVSAVRSRTTSRGSSFDDFLKQDSDAEKGTYVFHSGTDRNEASEGLRHRAEGIRGLSHSVYTNPFADEHGIDEHTLFENSLMDPKDEFDGDDLYSISDAGRHRDEQSRSATLSALPALAEVDRPAKSREQTPSSTTEPEVVADDSMAVGEEDKHDDTFSSIQAWAQTASIPSHPSNASFYSPLPETPAAPLSEPELISDGEMTPTDSASLAGSGEDIAGEARSMVSQQGHYYDVISDDEGILTPASWSEVGSVISESDAGAQRVHA